jgi:hypothetical protein
MPEQSTEVNPSGSVHLQILIHIAINGAFHLVAHRKVTAAGRCNRDPTFDQNWYVTNGRAEG